MTHQGAQVVRSEDGEVFSLPPDQLEHFLERRLSSRHFPDEVNLAEALTGILQKANHFVPSEAGSILLDDPERKGDSPRPFELTFISAFGQRAAQLVGARIGIDRGVAGRVYRSGETYVTPDTATDRFFDAAVDREMDYETRSLAAIPIRIDESVCGVLELVNRQGQAGYSTSDLTLLRVFADFISISIQSVLDGRIAQEIARKDNLTGLCNDRFLHIALTQTIERCRAAGDDLAVLFLDLDYFKRVNDTHGHLAGSQVLREVGAILHALTPQPEGVPARYGGDEFVIVAPGLDLDGAVDLAEEMRAAILNSVFLSAPGDIHPERLDLTGQTCSIGIATLRRHIAEEMSTERVKSTLLRLADSAMYVAKETGRNRTAVAGSPIPRRDRLV